MSKKIVVVSLVAAGLVGLAAILDLAAAWPFGQASVIMDVGFLIGSAIVVYLALDTLMELT